MWVFCISDFYIYWLWKIHRNKHFPSQKTTLFPTFYHVKVSRVPLFICHWFFCIEYRHIKDVRYFPERVFPSGNFPRIFSQAATSQMCNFPSFFLVAALAPPAFSNLNARPLANSCRSAPPIAACGGASIGLTLHLGSCHLGNYHLGSRPWENPFGKVHNTT